MDKVTSLFMSLDEAKERKIYVADDFSFDFFYQGHVTCQPGNIFDVCHVPKLNINLSYVSQLTQIGNIV
jgi:hypothetical protein